MSESLGVGPRNLDFEPLSRWLWFTPKSASHWYRFFKLKMALYPRVSYLSSQHEPNPQDHSMPSACQAGSRSLCSKLTPAHLINGLPVIVSKSIIMMTLWPNQSPPLSSHQLYLQDKTFQLYLLQKKKKKVFPPPPGFAICLTQQVATLTLPGA